MQLDIPAEFLPVTLFGAALAAAVLLGSFTFVVAQAATKGPTRIERPAEVDRSAAAVSPPRAAGLRR